MGKLKKRRPRGCGLGKGDQVRLVCGPADMEPGEVRGFKEGLAMVRWPRKRRLLHHNWAYLEKVR